MLSDGARAEYSFLTRWYIDAPMERVFAAIEDPLAWPSWWKAVVAVETLQNGGDDGVGRVTRSVWRGALGTGCTSTPG
jgi:uncharacterized protein YndB with AHSA1/START domain